MTFAIGSVAYTAKAGADAAAHAALHGDFAGDVCFFRHLRGDTHHDAGSADTGFIDIAILKELGEDGDRESFDPIGAIIGGDDELFQSLGEKVFPKDFFLVASADDDGHLPRLCFPCHEEDRRDADAAADTDDMIFIHIEGGAQRPQAVDHISCFQVGHGFGAFADDAVDDLKDALPWFCAGDRDRAAQDAGGIIHLHMDELTGLCVFCDERKLEAHAPDRGADQLMGEDAAFFYIACHINSPSHSPEWLRHAVRSKKLP